MKNMIRANSRLKTMIHEIEAKIKVAALEPVAEKLKQLGAVFLHDIRQIDTYFMDVHKLLHKNDCGLRIRQQTIGNRQSAMITFKGPRSDSQYKSRPEYETGISDAAMTEKIFESLGYSRQITLEKERSIWQIDNCLVCLDQLPRLGCFIEVEGPDETTIAGVLKKLNLQDQPHITHGYASMMRHNLKQAGIQKKEIFLEQ